MSDSQQPKILITRLSHIGDCVFTLPVLCALRECFPNAHIAWAMESPTHKLLASHPDLDEIIKVPRGWLKSPKHILALRKTLRSRKFDLTIDPQSLTKSSGLAWLSGCRRRIGLSRPWGRELALWLNNERVSPKETHIVERSLELLRSLGIRRPEAQFKLPIDTSAQCQVEEWLEAQNISDYALINPGATWRSKQWDLERYGSVARYLQQVHRIPTLVLWAGDEEHQQAESICTASVGAAKLAPSTSLAELAAIAQRSSLFISGDTGPLHIAAAAGAPVVGLYGATKPSHCGAYGDRAMNLQIAYQSGSAKQRRRASNEAMLAITVDHVCEAIDQQLARAAKSTSSRVA